jgi:hypothetical protein
LLAANFLWAAGGGLVDWYPMDFSISFSCPSCFVIAHISSLIANISSFIDEKEVHPFDGQKCICRITTHEEWKETEFPDCKPVFWDNKAGFSDNLTIPLMIQFGDISLWHGIKAAFNGKRHLVYQIRKDLPRILDKMYDDALRHRRTLLSAPSGGTRKLFIDIKPSKPDRNFPCQTLKIRKVSIVVMGS